ncbi:hypothetical protein K440DRAFT_614656 [Wilcoxina mikolae CBS 423.85]|nr:hypothetical protein K440DRAFT_614656 [Wilcoxina mikolae CBS 423.85]
MRSFRTSIVVLLAAAASTCFAQSPTSITRPRSLSLSAEETKTATATVKTTEVSYVASPTPSSTRESSEYFPPGVSYDDPTQAGGDPTIANDKNGGGAGKSTAFMGAGVGAQIGIISGVVVLAIALFVGTVIYYFHRRKQWEKEVKRRSALPPNAKLVWDKKTGEVSLADRSSSASKMGLAELEKGGHKVGKIEGEVKPGFFKMLLGRF